MKYAQLTLRPLVTFTASMVALAAIAPTFAADIAPSSDKERELIAVLASEDSPRAEKAITCKLLAIHGSAAAVPQLSLLLNDEQLASWSRIALEAIPGPEADEALRKASQSLSSRLLIGTINSIGVRRDAQAVDVLAARLNDLDAEVASAAAVALGRIGNPAAIKVLRPLLATSPAAIRSAVAEGAVLCAERSLSAGDKQTAVALYNEIRKSEVPKQRVIEATRGAILALPAEAGIALLLEQFKSPERGLFNVGLSTAREFPGSAIDKALADEMPKLTPDRAALVVTAMADRKDTVVLAAILKAAEKGPKPVRQSAIEALGRVGDVSCLTSLIQIAAESDEDLVNASKEALGNLPGDGVNKAIVARLSKAEPKLYTVLLEVVGQRRIEAIPELLKALDNSDKAVRAAALKSMGTTVPAKNLPSLIAQVVSPKHPEDAPIAQQALETACIRMPDRDACSQELTTAMDKAPLATKSVLLNIMAAVGGTKALETVGKAAKSKEPELQDTSSRLLGKWMTIDAAPVLLDLAVKAPEEKFQLRAMGGYIRIARQFAMSDEERLAMCQSILDISRKPQDHKTVLEILARYSSIDSLKMACRMMDSHPELKDDATQTAIAIAQKLKDKGPEVAEVLSKAGLGKVKLEVLKAEYGAGDMMKDVTETIQKQVADTQLIPLPMSTYNESFGGDPAPGAPKQLKIRYKINGKENQVSLAENALIVLPMPK